MQMVIQDREATNGNREDSCKFLLASIDPFFAVELPLPEQEGLSHAARDAVIPAGHGNIDKVPRAIVMGESPRMIQPSYRQDSPGSRLQCLSFPFVPTSSCAVSPLQIGPLGFKGGRLVPSNRAARSDGPSRPT